MKEDLITFETAVLAKEKGFDIYCDKIWVNYYTGFPLNKWKIISSKESSLSFCEFNCPTQSLLQKWLREKHGIDVSVAPYYNPPKYPDKKYYEYAISNIDNNYDGFLQNSINRIGNDVNFDTIKDSYEEALEMGLQEALKLINISQ